IGARGPHVAPGAFRVTLEVDGAPVESKTFDVRADPTSSVTPAQHRAREAFALEVMALLERVEAMSTDLRTRLTATSGDEATRLQALQTRLVGGGGRGIGGGGGGGGGGAGGGPGARGPQPVRQRLAALLTAFTGSGARTGTLGGPTGTMRDALAEVKNDLAAIEKEIKGGK